MSLPKVQPDEKLWLILIGACLTSKSVRDFAVNTLDDADAPPLLTNLWSAIRSGKAESVRAEAIDYGIDASEGTIIESLLRTVQQRALENTCRAALTQVSVIKGVNTESVLTFLDTLTSKIRTKQAAIKKRD